MKKDGGHTSEEEDEEVEDEKNETRGSAALPSSSTNDLTG